jgi:hypothetical protein
MLLLTTLMADNAFHTPNWSFRDDDEKPHRGLPGGAIASTASPKKPGVYNPIPLSLVVPRDPLYHKPFTLNCTCSGCKLYRALEKEGR